MRAKVRTSFMRVTGLVLSLLLLVMAGSGCSGRVNQKKSEQVSQQTSGQSGAQSSGQSAAQPAGQTPQQTKAPGSAELSLPISTKPLTLKCWVDLGAKHGAVVKSFAELSSYKELEKRTGVTIQFLHPPAAQANEQFNLMLASGDLPDIIEWSWRTMPGGPAKAISDKSIVKLNDLINQYAPNFKKVMEDHPDWKKQAVLDDGTFYVFPFIRDDDVLTSYKGFQIRRDWLDKLGLKLPATIDDWYKVLKAFREKDPNGNGNPGDEIPFVHLPAFEGYKNFMYAWGLSPHNSGFYINKEGKVGFSYIQPQYKDYLTTMRQWYKEGLLDPDFPTIDRKAFDVKMTTELGGACVGGPEMGFLGYFMKMMKDKNPNFILEGVAYPVGPAGKAYGWKDTWVTGHGAAITTTSKYQKEATQLLDYGYSKDGRTLMNFGQEGQAYNLSDGKIKFTEAAVKAAEGFDAFLSRHGRGNASGPFVQNRAYVDQGRTYFPQQSQAVDRWKQADVSQLFPPAAVPSPEESQRISAIMNEVNTHVAEMENKYIMGQAPLDEFDKFAENLKKMGIEEAIKIHQAIYERYNKR